MQCQAIYGEDDELTECQLWYLLNGRLKPTYPTVATAKTPTTPGPLSASISAKVAVPDQYHAGEVSAQEKTFGSRLLMFHYYFCAMPRMEGSWWSAAAKPIALCMPYHLINWGFGVIA